MRTPVPKSKTKDDPHLPVNITASERARQYQRGTFHTSENLLFCSTCNVVVDHLRNYLLWTGIFNVPDGRQCSF